MLSDRVIEMMNNIRTQATELYVEGELVQIDYNLLMNLAESILREHDGEGVRR